MECTRRSRVRRAVASIVLAFAVAVSGAVVASPATAAAIGTGAVSVKGPGSELVPGTTVEIRKDTCDGPAVWYTVTQSRPDAYGAFGIGLEPGQYCVRTLAAPAPYSVAADVIFTMEARPANWVTVWLPGPPPIVTVSGALVAKDETGAGVNGLTALITQGACGTSGPGVWQNTTATSRWSSGGFGISLQTGPYCATAIDVPPGISMPAAVTVDVTAPGPTWITLWVARIPISGTGNDVVPVWFASGEKIVEFSCPACSGHTAVIARGDVSAYDLLVNVVGAYTGKQLVGLTDYYSERYTRLEVTANAPWTLRVSDVSSARQVWNTASGTGDDVVYFAASGSIATVSNHPVGSSYLGVMTMGSNGAWDLIVNELVSSSGYWGRSPIVTPSFVEVRATGSWQIDVR